LKVFPSFPPKGSNFCVDYPQFHLNVDGQKLVFDFVKWVLVGLVAFYTFDSFQFKSKALFQEWGHTALKGLSASWDDVPHNQHLLGCWLSPEYIWFPNS
jgi:hypothetical protein